MNPVRYAEELQSKLWIVDGHCDTLQDIWRGTRDCTREDAKGHLDLPRLRRGGVKVQFFAAFVHPDSMKEGVTRVMELVDAFHVFVGAGGRGIRPVYSYADIIDTRLRGKIGALLTVEGGEALGGSLAVLRNLYRLGVRVLTLTWNHRNELGDGVMEDVDRGLTPFGREVVEEMNRLGMLIDVSHLGPVGVRDVLRLTEKPVVASHSNCYQLCPHPRNLSDEQIRGIAEAGGVIGATFVPDFVDPEVPSLERLLDHIDHMVRVGGIACVGIGSDFDGFTGVLNGLEDAGEMINLIAGLLERGYKENEVEMILGGNLLRVIRETIG